jgi:hypothetical protein
MITENLIATLRAIAMVLVAMIFVASCGGSGGAGFTDLPTHKYSSIILTVAEAVLIGGDDSRQVLFNDEDGERRIDLLDLTNYSEPVVFGEVKAGNYTKLRLMLDSIELVPTGETPAFFLEKLPANGKVDLLHPDGFEVIPGRMLTIEVDVDANKSIKITDAGNSGKVNFRPVVKVNIYDSGLPEKLARIEGMVSGEPNSTDNSFVLCGIDAPEHCIDVATDDGTTSFFDDAGVDTDFGGLSDGAMVVVIGEYSNDPYLINALIVEIGGTAKQLTGQVVSVSEPADNTFLVLTVGGMDVTIELQTGTKYYDENGPVGAEAIAVGKYVEVEGVMLSNADLMRAALVFLESPDDEQLSGTIAVGTLVKDAVPAVFELATDGGPVCVRVNDGADVLLVKTTTSEVTIGTSENLEEGQVVDLFGTTASDSCFEANEIIVDDDASTTP